MKPLTYVLAVFILGSCAGFGQRPPASDANEWWSYGHDPGGMRFSPLKQINTRNVQLLQRAWTYVIPPTPNSGIAAFEATPLMVDNVLYFTTPTSQAIAVDAETGKQIWKFDPDPAQSGTRRPNPSRGAAYWEGQSTVPCGTESSQSDKRLFYITEDAHLVALDPKTGRPCTSFGDGGSVNLRIGVADRFPEGRYDSTSPPAIYRDLVITGSELQEFPSRGPSGDIRAFDVRTGKLVWRFHTVPRPGEVGHDTWSSDGWQDRSGVNAWSVMSVDAARGMLFLPLGSPSYDFYGADRKGKGLFGDSLVALNAATGKLMWYFQMVHHDIWDYDVCSPPALITVLRDGKDIPAVAQVTKMGFVFVLDRLTGKPLFPVEERPVAASPVPGEATWPTQPFPIKSMQLARTSVTRDDITSVTPESRQYCLDNFGAALPGGIFNPWGLKLTVEMPGTLGGGNWSGSSFDPALDYLFVNVSEVGAVGYMKPQPAGSPEAYEKTSKWGAYARFWDDRHYPCQKPPWGDLNAIDLKTGKLVWKVPLGVMDDLAARGVPKTGTYNLGGSIATAGGLVFIGGTVDQRFRAFDARTGKKLWVDKLESNAHATPMTYLGQKTKKQFVVVAIGPGGYFNPDNSAPTVLAAYALYPKGQGPARLQAEAYPKTISSSPGSEPPELPAPAHLIVQPIPFNHRKHAQAGFPCETCHEPLGTSGKMQIPGPAECMNCHQTIKRDSPAIQELVRMREHDRLIAWKPIYKLPDFVYFSHEKHLAAHVECSVCHGLVKDRDQLWQEKQVSMVACVNCHKLRHAPVNCDACHNIGH